MLLDNDVVHDFCDDRISIILFQIHSIADICAFAFLSSLVLNACGSPGHIENYFYNRPDYKGAFHSRELKNEIAIFAVKCRPGG